MRRLGLVTPLLLAACGLRLVERVDVTSEQLTTTQAHELGGRWRNLTEVCVDADGTVAEARTVRPSGDPLLDLLYLDTVSKWRYQPRPSQGQRCTRVLFDQKFGPERDLPRNFSDSAAPAKCVSVKVVAGSAIYNPKPPYNVLASLARRHDLIGWKLINRTSFCIEPDGTTSAVKTVRSTGFVEIDRITRTTVETWRYAPYRVDGRPTRVCTTIDFNFRFQ